MSCLSVLTMVAVNRPEAVYFSSGPARLYKKLHAKQTQVQWIGCTHCTGLPFKPGEVVGRLPCLISATSCGRLISVPPNHTTLLERLVLPSPSWTSDRIK